MTPAFSGVPNKDEQNQKWLAFAQARKRAEMLRHPCILVGPQQRGTKSEVAASCYVTLALSGVPNIGEQNE